jgi:hypothetical protein
LIAPDFAIGGKSDEFITHEIQLEIAFEVICQLDMAEERRNLLVGEQSLRHFLNAQVVFVELDMGMDEIEIHMTVTSIPSHTLPTPSIVSSANYTSWVPTKVQSNGVNAHMLDAMIVQRIVPCFCTSGVQGATSVIAKRRRVMSSPAGSGRLIKVKMELCRSARLAAKIKEGFNKPLDPGGEVEKGMILDLSLYKSLAPTQDCLPTPEIQLYIVINVVSYFFAGKEARSLLVREHSLRVFILDQIFSLYEVLELRLVPHIIKVLLAHKLVVASQLDIDKLVDVQSNVDCNPGVGVALL